MDSNSLPMPMSDPNAWATAMNNLGMAPMSMTGQPIMSGKNISLLYNGKQSRCVSASVYINNVY